MKFQIILLSVMGLLGLGLLLWAAASWIADLTFNALAPAENATDHTTHTTHTTNNKAEVNE